MSRDETKKLLLLMEATYPNFKVRDSSMVDAWHVQLKDDEYNVMETALVAFNRTNTTGFAPSIGQLLDTAYNISTPELNENEAWTLVRNRLASSTYYAQENWESLPEVVKKAVSADQLRAWAMDSNYNEGVAQSNFLKSYRNAIQQKKDFAKLPAAIQNQIAQASAKLIGVST